MNVTVTATGGIPREVIHHRDRLQFFSILAEHINQQTRVYPYPLGVGSARPNPKTGTPDPENPLFLGFSVLGGGFRPWSLTVVSEGARPWGRGRSGDSELTIPVKNWGPLK